MIVNSQVPTERARHIYVQYFAIQDWKEWGCIKLIHIPGILNPCDDLTKLLGWVFHSRHCRRFMGHYASLIFYTIILLMYIHVIDEYFYITGVCYRTKIDHSPNENSPPEKGIP